MTPYFIFTIDMDAYAGNFEREMAWYVTGEKPKHMPGGVEWLGEKIQEESFKPLNIWLHYVATHENYVGILNTPKEGPYVGPCNTVAIYLYKRPADEVIETMKSRAKAFCLLESPRGGMFYEKARSEPKEPIQVLGFRLLEVAAKETSL